MPCLPSRRFSTVLGIPLCIILGGVLSNISIYEGINYGIVQSNPHTVNSKNCIHAAIPLEGSITYQ